MLVGGCSQSGSVATLDERANKYWELKQAKRWEEVYDGYLDPTLKGVVSKDAFLKKRLLAFDILGYSITETTLAGERATVRVTNEVNLPLREPGGTVRVTRKTVETRDEWVRRDGIWYVRLSE
jgi:hypothetical protein